MMITSYAPILTYLKSKSFETVFALCASLSMYDMSEEVMNLFNLLFGWDKLSYLMVGLSLVVLILMLESSKTYEKITALMSCNLSLIITLIVFFSTTNIMMFFGSFELSLIPTYMMIMGWGYQPERLQAAWWLMMYTIFGSLPLLMSVIKYYFIGFVLLSNTWLSQICPPSFEEECYKEEEETLLQLPLLLAFLIKLPLYGVHMWLPMAHVEAPVMGSMVLAGVLLKMGIYGILRFLPCLEKSENLIMVVLLGVSSVGSLLSSMACMSMSDIKAIIAFSSISHMNFGVLSLIVSKALSFMGVLLLSVSHGLVSALLFFLVDILYKASGTRSVWLNKGVMSSSAVFAMLWLTSIMINIAFPPTMGMFSEIFISLSVLHTTLMVIPLLILYFTLSGWYTVMLYSSITHGRWYNMFSPIKVSVSSLHNWLLLSSPVLLAVPLMGYVY